MTRISLSLFFRIVNFLIVVAVFVISVYFQWTEVNIIIATSLTAFVIYSIPADFLTKATLVAVVIIPFLLFTKSQNMAEEVAILAYWLLILATIKSFIEIYGKAVTGKSKIARKSRNRR